MPTPPLEPQDCQIALDAHTANGRRHTKTCEQLHLTPAQLTRRLTRAKLLGLQPRVAPVRYGPSAKPPPPPPTGYERDLAAPIGVLGDSILVQLRKSPLSLSELADKFGVSKGRALDEIESLQTSGHNLHLFGDKYSIEKTPRPTAETIPEYVSRPDGSYLFGVTSDNHICSKYARADVLNNLYDNFAAQGVDRVLNAGNWIDGEASFNRHDLLVHGMDAQLQTLAKEYPKRDGIQTYAVAGADHEGWYCSREGVDIGKYAEGVMHSRGRDDWHDLGFMEAYIRLRHAKTGANSMLHVIHPGGGSAYAISYTVQKIVEAYDGGDKPAIMLAGHYHKLAYSLVRNVHTIQTGCTQDQTPFMRQKKLAAHVGGGICQLRQDENTGAITSCRIEFFNYFVRGYYNDRWSRSGDVTLADRGVE